MESANQFPHCSRMHSWCAGPTATTCNHCTLWTKYLCENMDYGWICHKHCNSQGTWSQFRAGKFEFQHEGQRVSFLIFFRIKFGNWDTSVYYTCRLAGLDNNARRLQSYDPHDLGWYYYVILIIRYFFWCFSKPILQFFCKTDTIYWFNALQYLKT